jgi:SAM-dependent methyltransferase
MNSSPHSSTYIDDSRLQWWDSDFLQFVAIKGGFSTANSVCDVGAGQGHWVRVLKTALPHLNKALLIDNDPYWVSLLHELANSGFFLPETNIKKADALSIPSPDNTFDLVTCQTLLMHLDNPLDAIREMLRICKPGGSILIAEPVNVLNRSQIFQALTFLPPAESSILLKAWMAYHRGVKLLKGLDYDIALRVPWLIAQAGLAQDEIISLGNPKMQLIDPGNTEILPEYSEENFEFACAGGLGRDEWNDAVSAAKKIPILNINSPPLHSLGGLELFMAKKK